MPRNGSGVYSPPATDYPAVPSTLIESTKYNNVITDIGTAISGSIAADGQTTVTQNIPMNSKKFTGLAAGGTAGDSVRYEQAGSVAMVETVAATTKATPVDADVLPIADSATSNTLKNLTWANLKAGIFAAWGVLTAAGTSKTTPVDADVIAIGDSAASNATKKLPWSGLVATLLATWKDATGGLVGLTLFKINFKNAANTFTSFFTNSNTAARTYTFPDKDMTVAGTDDVVPSAQTITATANTPANGLTIAALNSVPLIFRSATATDGATTTVNTPSANLVIPSGASLGSTNAVAATYVVVEMNNAGTREFAVSNQSGGLQCDETNLISTTAISAAATSASVWYSTTARTSLPYRVIGTFTATEATAGTWATAASAVQASFGTSLPGVSHSVLMGPYATTSGTSIDVTGIIATAKKITCIFNGLSSSGTSPIQLQLGAGSVQNTGYSSGGWTANTGNIASSTGLLIFTVPLAAGVYEGNAFLLLQNQSTGAWSCSSTLGQTTVPSSNGGVSTCGGSKTLSGVLDRIRLTTVGGTDTFDAGSFSILVEY